MRTLCTRSLHDKPNASAGPHQGNVLDWDKPLSQLGDEILRYAEARIATQHTTVGTSYTRTITIPRVPAKLPFDAVVDLVHNAFSKSLIFSALETWSPHRQIYLLMPGSAIKSALEQRIGFDLQCQFPNRWVGSSPVAVRNPSGKKGGANKLEVNIGYRSQKPSLEQKQHPYKGSLGVPKLWGECCNRDDYRDFKRAMDKASKLWALSKDRCCFVLVLPNLAEKLPSYVSHHQAVQWRWKHHLMSMFHLKVDSKISPRPRSAWLIGRRAVSTTRCM